MFPDSRPRAGRIVAIAAALCLATLPASAIINDTPVQTISGAWSGAGFVQKDAESDPMKVRCKIRGEQNGVELGFDGECRAMLILRREIGAVLKRSGERFTGQYVGATAGVADLDGGFGTDGRLVLTMRFPREVNGDDVATMMIDPHDGRSFTISTTDRMESGVEVTTSKITFERE
jgi:hypothetical protein